MRETGVTGAPFSRLSNATRASAAGAGVAWGALLLDAVGGCFGRCAKCFHYEGRFGVPQLLLMCVVRACHNNFLKCVAVNTGVNGISMLTPAYLVCTVHGTKTLDFHA